MSLNGSRAQPKLYTEMQEVKGVLQRLQRVVVVLEVLKTNKHERTEPRQ